MEEQEAGACTSICSLRLHRIFLAGFFEEGKKDLSPKLKPDRMFHSVSSMLRRIIQSSKAFRGRNVRSHHRIIQRYSRYQKSSISLLQITRKLLRPGGGGGIHSI